MTASVYDPETGDILTTGLQPSEVCDEALTAAQRIADRRRADVLLEDDDGLWLVHPCSADGSRESATEVLR